MTHPLLPSSNTALKQRLLTGASAAVIVLALAVAAPTGAMAQATELVDGTPITGDELDGIEETDAVAGVTVAIELDQDNGEDLNIGHTGNVSILNSTDQVVTLNVTDANDAVTNSDGDESYLVVDEAIVQDTAAGTIAINLSGDNSAGIVFNGDVTETTGTITIQAGDAGGGTDTFSLIFASDQDRDLTVDAAISNVGDDDIVLRVVDTEGTSGNSITFADTVDIGTDTGDLIIVDGNAAVGTQNGAADYDAAAAAVTAVFQNDVTAGQIQVDATSFGATLVLGANGQVTTVAADIDSLSAANAANLSIADAADVTLEGNINSTAAWNSITVGGGTPTIFTVAGSIADEAPITLNDNALLQIDTQNGTPGARTVASTIIGDGTPTGTQLQVLAGVDPDDAIDVTFTATVGADGNAINTIDLDDDATFTANVFGGILEVDANVTATFQGETTMLASTAAETGGIVVGNGTTAATVTIAGNAAHTTGGTTINNMGTLIIDDAANGGVSVAGTVNGTANATTTLQTIDSSGDGHTVTFDLAVGGGNPISVIDLDTNTVFTGNLIGGSLDVADTMVATLNDTTNILTGDITGDGTLTLGANDGLTLGADGQMSTVSINALNGGGDLTFAAGSMVTIETTVGTGTAIRSFSTNDGVTDTVVTINSGTAAGAETAITGSGTGATGLVLGAGTIVLGSNIGDTDTVFAFANEGSLITTADETTTVQLSANFLDGDITFATTNFDQTAAIDGLDVATNGLLEATQTALTTFTVNNDADVNNIVIAAAARSAADTAGLLGISTEDATALRQAVISTDATGDDEGLDALTAALNTGGTTSTQAALAARQVGTQEDTLGGGSQAAFQMFGEQTGVLTARLESMRSQSGFSSGDLDGPYSPQAPRSSSGVWGQAFGGVANADGDTLAEGYDAAYGGMIVGVDGMVSEDFTLGAFGSFAYTTVDGDGAGNSEIEASTFGFGVYAGYAGDGFYLDGFAAYAMSENDLSRRDMLNRAISADYDASQFSVGLAGGVPIEMSSNVFITPNASLTWNHYDADTYTETGSPMAQTVNPDDVTNLTGTIGARIHAVYENFDNDGTVFIPELRVALIGDLVDDDATAMATFAGTGVTAYQVTGTDTDDIGALIGVGFGLDNPDWAASLNYDADLRGDFMSHTARAEFRWKF